MKKIINPGKVLIGQRYAQFFCEIEIKDGNLSISGVEGPLPSGNCRGSCGQVIMNYKEYDNRGHMTLRDIVLNPRWNYKKLKKFFDVWDEWHLNDMQSGCEHQRALGWTYENHHGLWEDKPREVIVIDEYDDGTANNPLQVFNKFKGHLCPVCGYSIGSAWLKKELPEDIINFLASLPDSENIPAWV